MPPPPYILHKPLPKAPPTPGFNFDTSTDYSDLCPRTLVRRTNDAAVLLADPVTNDAELQSLLFRSVPGVATLAVLNHENIVSVHGDFAHRLVGFPADDPDGVHRYLVHDWCDAGTVASLLAAPPVRATRTGFLPESLVWHVALSVLRALRWLHEGVREVYEVGAGEGGRCRRIPGKEKAEEGWMPVLHCAVRGENIFVAQPRGIETYGSVRLGNFGKSLVLPAGKGVKVGVKGAGERRIGDVRGEKARFMEIKRKEGVRVAQKKVNMNDRPFYPATDLFDLGTVLFHMTTGHPIPGVAGLYSTKGQECSLCGCNHLTNNSDKHYVRCWHKCFLDINSDTIMDQFTDYTKLLQTLISDLLADRWDEQLTASDMLDQAWKGFEEWASTTPDGKLYRDVYDDQWWRLGNNQTKEWEDAASAMATGMDLGTDEVITV